MTLDKYTNELEKCAHCGFCQAVCPSFLSDISESRVARSRLMVIQAALLSKEIPMTKRVREIIDQCLVCSRCSHTCPCEVPVDDIVMSARNELVSLKKFENPVQGIKKRLMNHAMERRGEGRFMDMAKMISDKLDLRPKDTPLLAPRRFSEIYKGKHLPKGEIRHRVAYFTGCATNAIFPDTGDAVMKVLAENGVHVTLPEGMACCGMPVLANGDIETFRKWIGQNIGILSSLDVDAFITDCTTCLMAFSKKAKTFFDASDPLMASIKSVGEKFFEVTDYLNTIGLAGNLPRLEKTFTSHVPCHATSSDRLCEAPKRLLSQVEGARYIEPESSSGCCGAGGGFFMSHPALSASIRSRQMEILKNTGAEIIVTPCPSCRSYLGAGWLNSPQVIHPVTFLAMGYGFDILQDS